MRSTRRMIRVLSAVSVSIALMGWAAIAKAESATRPVVHFGGCGGVYFLVEPGEFWVEVEKIDLKESHRKTILRAILAGPDRSVLADEYLKPSKPEEPDAVERCRLSAHADREGVYALNITAGDDRYGEKFAWGFRTNCRRYVVETSRGHKDAAHEEPLVLLSPDASGEVCFRPERGAFSVDISKAPEGIKEARLLDAAGKEIAVIPLDAQGAGHGTIPAGDRSSEPWRLCLPAFKAVVQIDGVTRWPEGCDYPNFSLWTPDAASWFPLHENRWLITPYDQTVYTGTETKGSVEFRVHNNAFAPRTVKLNVEFPDQSWTAKLATDAITLQAGESQQVALTYTLPDSGDAWTCCVRTTAQDPCGLSTYSSFTLRRGVAPATQPLTIPLVLKPYTHENEQFGYHPTYLLTNQVYFNGGGQPFITSEKGVYRWDGHAWTETCDIVRADGQTAPLKPLTSKVAFSKNGDVYSIAAADKSAAVVYSCDGGATCRASALPGHGAFDIEQFSGHNTPDGPPPVVRYTLTEKDPKLIWRRLNDLDLILPEMDPDGALRMGEPVSISKKCIGFSAHSGIPSSVVSREGRVHVVWAEATDPKESVPGVPTFVVTYDRTTKTLGKPALVGYGPPANDVHNTPSMTMDSKGYLHVLVGTHGRTFKYARSLQPNDAGGGWTEAEDLGPGLRQTYVGFVCDASDTLHVVFRLWYDDRAYFPAGSYATLSYMRKRPGKPWTAPQPLVIAPFSEYSVFYHRLTIDPAGRLFLSYDYWSTYWFYRTDHWGTRRALMMSPDGGTTWKMAGTEDLAR